MNIKQTLILPLSLCIILILSGCSSIKRGGETSSSSTDNSTPASDYSNATSITLSDNNTETISKGGSYTISGTLSDGQLLVNTTEHVYLELAGVDITNSNGAALQVENAKDITLTLKSGTTNTFIDGGTSDYNAAIFSNDTLVIEGDGVLNITGNQEHGIESDDGVTIHGGEIIITAKNDGIHTKDNLLINGGIVTVKSAVEGIESKGDITINNGELSVTSSDDSINATTDITINGGTIYVTSSKGDGLDSNGNIEITGGTTVAIGSAAPEGGIDCDTNVISISGGTLIATGGVNTSPDEATSTQCSVILSGVAADTYLHIASETKEVVTFKTSGSYESIIISSPILEKGQTYIVSTGGTITNGSEFHGLYSDGAYANGATRETFTTETFITTQGGNAGMGGSRGGGMSKENGGQPPSGEIPSGEKPSGELPSNKLPQDDQTSPSSTTSPTNQIPSDVS